MGPVDLQQVFFRHIRSILPGHVSLADEVADLLNISNDSAYRRIRGEKPISLEEIQRLCIRYHISLDQLMNITSDNTVFFSKNLDGENFDLEGYLDGLLADLKQIDKAGEKMFFYEAKDLPLFYHFQYTELAIFKFFFWMRTAMGSSGYSKMYFEDNELAGLLQQKGPDILKTYSRIPSTEIWSIDSLNATIRQIAYYSYTGVFRKKETVALLYDQLGQTIEHIREQAEYGEKFLPDQKPQGDVSNFHLYYNEWFLGHNTMLVETDGAAAVYINHSVMNQVITKDVAFCDHTKRSLSNIIRRSLLISAVGEKERNRFFNQLKNKISKAKDDALDLRS